MPLGRDIGYLPGDKDEKLAMWMQPIFDNLAYLLSTRGSQFNDADSRTAEQRLDQLRSQFEAGRGDQTAVIDAEIAVEEARLRLLQCRADLSAIRDRKDDDD